jgi:hypothetical protein
MSNASNNKSGCLGLLLQMFGVASSTSKASTFPFRLRDDFLSPAEISFYHVLRSIAGDKFTVCPKVSLSDIFFVSRPDQNQAARNRISRKHVDFLLCDSRSMRPRVGIELDDSSHAHENRRTRDALVQQVFDAAGLPLLRFRAQRAYNISEIESLLSRFFAADAVEPALPASHVATSAPICPKCGIPLIIRSGRRGNFYGCSNYPKCRQSIPIS